MKVTIDMDNPFRRMIVLPEDEYNQLKYKRQDDKEPYWPWDTSVEREQKLYALSLRKHRESDDGGVSSSGKRDTTSIQSDIDLFPTSSRNRAQRLLATLKTHAPANIDWTEKGEVSFGPYGSTLSGSNLKDLIYHATSAKQRSSSPFGWSEFVQFLKSINAPVTMLNAETVREMGRTENAPSMMSSTLASLTSTPKPVTPKSRKRTRKSVLLHTPKTWQTVS